MTSVSRSGHAVMGVVPRVCVGYGVTDLERNCSFITRETEVELHVDLNREKKEMRMVVHMWQVFGHVSLNLLCPSPILDVLGPVPRGAAPSSKPWGSTPFFFFQFFFLLLQLCKF